MLDRSVWLHELAHLAARGARPQGPLGSRLMAGVDEGVADFVAATFSGSTVVGRRGDEERDLTAPPRLNDSEWAYLAVASAPFDAHRFGWALAGQLFREPDAPTLAADLSTSLASAEPFPVTDTPRAVLRSWISRCPGRSREALRRAVVRWMPPELAAIQEPS